MSDDIDQIREAFRALDESRPTDLIGRLDARISSGHCYYDKADEALDREAIARIRELESACYRLTEERDRLKGWADKYHDEVLELRSLKPKADE